MAVLALVFLALALGLVPNAGLAAGQDLSWWRTPGQKTPSKKSQMSSVDINQGSMEELMTVPGLSRVWAARIVRFRPYSNKYSLKLEGVLPGEVYERVKSYLVAHREK